MPPKNTPPTSFGFHSLFARLFISVFLVIIIFAIAMILLAQLIHSNSDGMKSKVIAEQVVGQIEPFLVEVEESQAQHNRLQARFVLAVVKKSFDIFDESLNAKIGLYDKNRRLILQTSNTDLPEHLPPTPSWLAQTLPTLSGREPPHIIVKTSTGYWVWYENRKPPKERPMLGMLNLLTGTILLVLMMTAVLWGIAHNMTWRLNQMSRLMAKMGDGDFSVRVNQSGNDEIAMLAYGFNQSAEKIEKLINANSLLLAHASHEFRTPITRIRLQVEMMDMLASKLSPDDKAKFNKRANAINRDLTGLNDLVESILLVSRLDAGHALQASEDMDFLELVNSECQHYTEVLLFGKSTHMIGQPKLLTHLIRNLINNALIHGVAPVEVYVYGAMTLGEANFIPKELTDLAKDHTSQDIMSVAHDGTHSDELATHLDIAETDPQTDGKKPKFLKLLSRHKHADADIKPIYVALSVVDQGAGIAEDKREDIFSPFVRLKQEKKGSGLGLSLVAQIAEAHGGSIITDTWQGKTRFLVVLPTQPKSSM